jgi:endonuclease/exonuclease/phosphatase family metal-dependent hydrolase
MASALDIGDARRLLDFLAPWIGFSLFFNSPMKYLRHFCFLILVLWKIDSTAGQIKILSQNIGGANFKINRNFKIEPACPLFKLCDSQIMARVRNQILALKPDVIFLQEALNLEQLTQGLKGESPLLPQNYVAVCGAGAGGLKEVCLAWNKSKAESIGPCRSIFGAESGAIKCTLKIDKTLIAVINVHPSAWFESDRRQLIYDVWDKLVVPGQATLVAGDFNTTFYTYSDNSPYPYPPEFGTIFGRSVQDYGRKKPKKSYYGYEYYKSDGDRIPLQVWGSTIFGEKIDHVFSNFGDEQKISLNTDSMPCGSFVCLGNQKGFAWGPADWSFFTSWGPKTDHLPILALVAW